MKRFLKITLIILLLIVAIVGTLFFIARKRAINNNATPPTFRQFLGIGTTGRNTDTSPIGTDGSEFTTPDETTPSVPTQTTQIIPTGTSIFTNGGFTPAGTTTPDVIIGGGTGGNGGGGTGGNGGGTGGNGGGGPGGPGGGIVVTAAPSCSDEDTTITFTPDEINRLNVLKNRFFAIAETLHTDADVSTETINYDNFKAKADKITEMYDFCVNSPVFTSAQTTVVAQEPYGATVPGTNGAINYRVPTPFWRDATKDNQAFVHQGSRWQGIFADPDLIFPERSIEHALRLNLW